MLVRSAREERGGGGAERERERERGGDDDERPQPTPLRARIDRGVDAPDQIDLLGRVRLVHRSDDLGVERVVAIGHTSSRASRSRCLAVL